jgi:high-affinity iron transporter
MLATAIIVFREVLEASLVVGIVLAASRGVLRRGVWVSAGIAAGVFGAALVAACAEGIANAVNGIGQELFNAAILFTAVAMLGWHNIWMNRHGRELAAAASTLGKGGAGRQPASLCVGCGCWDRRATRRLRDRPLSQRNSDRLGRERAQHAGRAG